MQSPVANSVSTGSFGGRLTAASEVICMGVGLNFTLLKYNDRLAVLSTSAALLSERKTRLIRTGIKLFVIGVSEPRITPEVPGRFTLNGDYQMSGVGEILQVRRKCTHISGNSLIVT